MLPLRALAEAYGLEVEYDATNKMATVAATAVEPTVAPDPTSAPDVAAVNDSSDWSAEDEAFYKALAVMPLTVVLVKTQVPSGTVLLTHLLIVNDGTP